MSGEIFTMKFLIILLLLLSCSSPKRNENKTDFWWILENYSPEWDKEKIISLFGNPDEIYPRNGEDNWVYREEHSKFQLWAIGITKESKVSGLAYLVEGHLYIMDIEDRWKSKKCEHKKETVLVAGHHYTEERKFICDNGKIEVFYNRFNEVEGIYVK